MPQPPHRIGYYDDSTGPGGTTRYLRELISGLPREQFQPVLFAPAAREWHRELSALEVEIVTLDGGLPAPEPAAPVTSPPPSEPVAPPKSRRPPLPRPVAWGLGLVKELRRLERLFRLASVDLVHSNNCGAEAAPLAARRAGHRVLGTWHVDSTYDLEGTRNAWYYRRLERASMLALDHAIAVSAATREDWLRRCGLGPSYTRRVSVIHNGVDLTRLERKRERSEAKRAQGLSPETLVIGSLGRLEPAKDYGTLVEALPAVLRLHPHTVLLIGGRGPLRESLEARAQELGVAHALRWAGFVSDVREVLEAADVYVQPSLCEALGLGLIEAQALGVPAVITRIGGMPEVIEEGVTGSSVPVSDPAALAAALSQWLSDPEKRSQAGRAGTARVSAHFDQRDMVRQTAALYRQLLASSGTAPKA